MDVWKIAANAGGQTVTGYCALPQRPAAEKLMACIVRAFGDRVITDVTCTRVSLADIRVGDDLGLILCGPRCYGTGAP